jgi:DnaJ-class molecular chaperone
MIDPYKILGVQKTATQDEIKKAYRSLAKKNHPDLNPGNKKAEAAFKDISHANDLIGTPEAREKFDRGEINDQQEREWERYYGQGQQRHSGGPRQNRYSQNFANQFEDADWFSEFFNTHKGQQERSDRDVHYQMNITFKEAILGAEKVISLPNGKRLQVKIPAGINDGAKLRFKNQGEQGQDEKSHGDAYIQFTIEPLSGWTRNGNDIETELPISFIEGVLGANISVPTMHGPVMMTIPPGVSTDTKLRIKGKGVITSQGSGNQIVKLKVVLPKNITPELANAMNQLKDKYNYNPRSDHDEFSQGPSSQTQSEARG